MKKISSFLRLVCKHEYFKDGLARDVVITPNTETHQLMHNYKIFAKFESTGFRLAYDEQHIDQLSQLDNIKLSFHLKAQDSLFFNFTALSNVNTNQQIFNFTNVDTNNLSGDIIVLHKKAYVQKEDLIDRQELGINDLRAVGCINIELDNQQLISLKTNELLNYEIRFKNREVYWRYCFIDHSKDEQTNYIINSQKDIAFSAPEETVLPNGETAWAMSSKEPIGLKEQYDFSFDFTKEKSGKNTTIKLPMADATNLRAKDDGKIYTDMYIYL